MLELFDPSNVSIFFRYVLAGYIILSIRNAYFKGARPALAESALDIIVLSVINQAVWLLLAGGLDWLTLLAIANWPAIELAQPDPTFLLFMETLVTPTLLGFALVWSLRRGIGRGFARRLGMAVTGPNLRVYDDIFSSLAGPTYMIVTLEDGTTVYGLFGHKSRAGRDREKEEIYFEVVFEISEGTEAWVAATPPRGAIVSLTKLKSIEILH